MTVFIGALERRLGRLCQSQFIPTQMPDTQWHKDPRKTYPDTQTFGTTAATHLGGESATQSEPAAETAAETTQSALQPY